MDVFAERFKVGHLDLSPDGKYLALSSGVEGNRHMTVVSVFEIKDTGLTRVKSFRGENLRVYGVNWANNTRLLVSMQAYDPKTDKSVNRRTSNLVRYFPSQLIAMDADLSNKTVLLEGQKEFEDSFDKSEVLHWLPDDPDHILMELWDGIRNNLDVYKVNVYTGKADEVQGGNQHTIGWIVDGSGVARIRIHQRLGITTVLGRDASEGDWFEMDRFRLREVPDILPLAFSADPNILYVISRKDGDRQAAYEYDMTSRTLGKLLFAHPQVDVTAGLFTEEGTRPVGFQYVIHKPKAHFIAPQFAEFEGMLEKAFGAENYARPVASTQEGELAVLHVTGPRDPGSFYLYNARTRKADLVGVEMASINPQTLGRVQPITYAARDGLEINAYLTLPPGNIAKPPLVVMPHGGPEARDYLAWHPWVQFLATRGYAVLQPNFRGSDGYGKKFVEAGYKQWGLKMQDDITDGVRHVLNKGLVDGRRVCIFGASYGGYAALAGAAFTPELYRCAISMNGLGDLKAIMRWERTHEIAYHYWKKSIGDPGDREDRKRMESRSPINAISAIRAPILLLAGEKDETVPPSQSRAMAKALKDAGKPHQYIEFEGEGHGFKEFENRRTMLLEVEGFLARHIGAATVAPQ